MLQCVTALSLGGEITDDDQRLMTEGYERLVEQLNQLAANADVAPQDELIERLLDIDFQQESEAAQEPVEPAEESQLDQLAA